ncbi:putative membrane protein [Mycetocola sp. CAN_C7]|uniref:hypothetical protein n=1 Tax=Mycetocola sp. CAN_C7 TaxID=2787724 RepID=UPI0018CAE3C1
MTDPTRVRSQAALTTSTGLIWILLGTVLAAICVAVLLTLVGLAPVVAWTGVALVVALYVGLLIVRFAVRPGSRRLVAMASVFGAIALVTLICVVLISGSAWGSLG